MTAKDLLLKLLDYSSFWYKAHFDSAPPSTVRQAQIESLQKAFGLTKEHIKSVGNERMPFRRRVITRPFRLHREIEILSDYQFLTRGKFLEFRPENVNSKLTSLIESHALEHFGYKRDEIIGKIHLGWMFTDLLRFREDIYKFTYPSAGMLEGFSAGLMYGKHLQNKFKANVSSHLYEIDEVLWLLLDPEQREISMDTLISDFQYPDVNLDSIDLEWRIQNY